MRIYNGTNAQISLPYPGKRVEVPAHAISGDIGANTEVISLLVTGYGVDEIAFVVSGPYELNLCSSIPTVTSYVVQSIEEAVARFAPASAPVAKKEEVKAEKKEVTNKVETPKLEEVVEEEKEEEVYPDKVMVPEQESREEEDEFPWETVEPTTCDEVKEEEVIEEKKEAKPLRPSNFKKKKK